jgi:sugar O-acyltransferase (sialic acid O-acetyltransferase NeuD family)
MILGIYGSGGFGREVIDMLPMSNFKNLKGKVLFIDDFRVSGEEISGVRNVKLDEYKSLGDGSCRVLIAVGSPEVRKLLREKLDSVEISLATFISDSAFVSTLAKLEPGVLISNGVSIANNCEIGINTSINLQSILGHDVKIGSDCSISSQVNIGGGTRIGDQTYIGMGVQIREGVSIGQKTVIGMGSVVFTDIPAGVIAVGNPARVVRKNETGVIFGNSR